MEEAFRKQRSLSRELESRLQSHLELGSARLAVINELRLSRQAEEALRRDICETREWTTYQSREETRDVLECGVRRLALEARLGRAASAEDVKDAMGMPLQVRKALAG